METPRRFRFVREELRRGLTGFTRWGAIVFALIALPLGMVGALKEPVVLVAVLGLAAALVLMAMHERKVEAKYWAMHETAGMWFDGGKLYWADARHEVHDRLDGFVRVRIYTSRGRVHRLVGEHRDGIDREYLALDDMDAFLAEFRRHAPHASFDPADDRRR
ncbi:hypothetical protein LVB77_18445 [Lysobacter sp. 5GHs7-4]|uniref:hypothetical protein n=1 Tax=Lysobacter sp. 5GHs7-4 TaxID=2904253 RepID=UPI001E2CAE69|nr:hypothetical protein [Lysobacter sp. 5GHs7-4]UHQ22605.1 hypothetical protein LVB77_18445 [Lysobacter sp. 5GHs7-4]